MPLDPPTLCIEEPCGDAIAQGFRIYRSRRDYTDERHFDASLAMLGDVNGDGLDDLGVMFPRDELSEDPRVTAHVVFGKRDHEVVFLDELGPADGFTVTEPPTSEVYGDCCAIQPAGDVNGDGFADVALRFETGREVFVVFGSSSPRDLELSEPPTGSSNSFFVGLSRSPSPVGSPDGWEGVHCGFSGVGDVDSDGFADLFMAHSLTSLVSLVPTFTYWLSLGAFVVPGSSAPTSVTFDRDLHPIPAIREVLGLVSGVTTRCGLAAPRHDLTGDGAPDLALLSYGPARATIRVFALPRSRLTEDVAFGPLSLGPAGYELTTSKVYLGLGLDTLNDLNGDGRGELVVVSSGPKKDTDFTRPNIYVLYGRAPGSSYDLDRVVALGEAAVLRSGPTLRRFAQPAVARLGDLDGDGLDDLLIGEPYTASDRDPPSQEPDPEALDVGRASLVLGRGITPGTHDLDDLTRDHGLRFVGTTPGSYFGQAVAAGGDLDGDGIPDLAIAVEGPRVYGPNIERYYSSGHVDVYFGASLRALLPR